MKKHVNLVSLVLFASFVLSACGAGQLLGPTPTPTSTLTPVPTLTSTPQPLSVEQVNTSVAKIVSEGGIQEYVLCNLDAAVWGAYDIEVKVASGYTRDSSAHIFTIRDSVFAEKSTSEGPSSPATVEGRGIVAIDNPEMAFDLGIPFFITDVRFDGASSLTYTVISNPKISIEHASVALERISDSGYSVVINTPHPFSSGPEPQHLTFEISGDPPGDGSYLSIQKVISGTYSTCLLSNQVDVGSLGTP